MAGTLNLSAYIGAASSMPAADKFRPLHLRYLSYDTQANTFKLLLDKGDGVKGLSPKGAVPEQKLQSETKTLLKYFLIGVTLPNDSFWVNLRPDSPDNVIDNYLAFTDIGKILLEADVQLKKDTASYTSPNTPEGRIYWNKLYERAGELFGYDNITIPTLTRPWIVPGEIIIRESKDNAYIYKATLKVMLEQDYLKDSATYNFTDPRMKVLNEYSSQLIRELIIPKITKEVNTSKKYAPLRQVYYSLILAQWFKSRFKGLSPNGAVSNAYINLIDSRNLANLASQELWSKITYFDQYQRSFKDGEYNVKEPVQTPYGQTVRSYFSGGANLSIAMPGANQTLGTVSIITSARAWVDKAKTYLAEFSANSLDELWRNEEGSVKLPGERDAEDRARITQAQQPALVAPRRGNPLEEALKALKNAGLDERDYLTMRIILSSSDGFPSADRQPVAANFLNTDAAQIFVRLITYLREVGFDHGLMQLILRGLASSEDPRAVAEKFINTDAGHAFIRLDAELSYAGISDLGDRADILLQLTQANNPWATAQVFVERFIPALSALDLQEYRYIILENLAWKIAQNNQAAIEEFLSPGIVAFKKYIPVLHAAGLGSGDIGQILGVLMNTSNPAFGIEYLVQRIEIFKQAVEIFAANKIDTATATRLFLAMPDALLAKVELKDLVSALIKDNHRDGRPLGLWIKVLGTDLFQGYLDNPQLVRARALLELLSSNPNDTEARTELQAIPSQTIIKALLLDNQPRIISQATDLIIQYEGNKNIPARMRMGRLMKANPLQRHEDWSTGRFRASYTLDHLEEALSKYGLNTPEDLELILKENGFRFFSYDPGATMLILPICFDVLLSAYRGSFEEEYAAASLTHDLNVALAYGWQGGEVRDRAFHSNGTNAIHEFDLGLIDFTGRERTPDRTNRMAFTYKGGDLPEYARKRTIILKDGTLAGITEQLLAWQLNERIAKQNIYKILNWIMEGGLSKEELAIAVNILKGQVEVLKNQCGLKDTYFETVYGYLNDDLFVSFNQRYIPGKNNSSIVVDILKGATQQSAAARITLLDYLQNEDKIRHGTFDEADVSTISLADLRGVSATPAAGAPTRLINELLRSEEGSVKLPGERDAEDRARITQAQQLADETTPHTAVAYLDRLQKFVTTDKGRKFLSGSLGYLNSFGLSAKLNNAADIADLIERINRQAKDNQWDSDLLAFVNAFTDQSGAWDDHQIIAFQELDVDSSEFSQDAKNYLKKSGVVRIRLSLTHGLWVLPVAQTAAGEEWVVREVPSNINEIALSRRAGELNDWGFFPEFQYSKLGKSVLFLIRYIRGRAIQYTEGSEYTEGDITHNAIINKERPAWMVRLDDIWFNFIKDEKTGDSYYIDSDAVIKLATRDLSSKDLDSLKPQAKTRWMQRLLQMINKRRPAQVSTIPTTPQAQSQTPPAAGEIKYLGAGFNPFLAFPALRKYVKSDGSTDVRLIWADIVAWLKNLSGNKKSVLDPQGLIGLRQSKREPMPNMQAMNKELFWRLAGIKLGVSDIETWKINNPDLAGHMEAQLARLLEAQKGLPQYLEGMHVRDRFIDAANPQFRTIYSETRAIVDALLRAQGFDPKDFEMFLIDTNDIDAFTLSGTTKIFISLGLVKMFIENSGSKDALASILAHEFRHINQWLDDLAEGIDIDYRRDKITMSRAEEYDADIQALSLLDMAGFTVKDAPVAFQLLLKSGFGLGGLSHPPTEERLRKVERLVDQLGWKSYFEEPGKFSEQAKKEVYHRTAVREYQDKIIECESFQALEGLINDARDLGELIFAMSIGYPMVLISNPAEPLSDKVFTVFEKKLLEFTSKLIAGSDVYEFLQDEVYKAIGYSIPYNYDQARADQIKQILEARNSNQDTFHFSDKLSLEALSELIAFNLPYLMSIDYDRKLYERNAGKAKKYGQARSVYQHIAGNIGLYSSYNSFFVGSVKRAFINKLKTTSIDPQVLWKFIKESIDKAHGDTSEINDVAFMLMALMANKNLAQSLAKEDLTEFIKVAGSLNFSAYLQHEFSMKLQQFLLENRLLMREAIIDWMNQPGTRIDSRYSFLNSELAAYPNCVLLDGQDPEEDLRVLLDLAYFRNAYSSQHIMAESGQRDSPDAGAIISWLNKMEQMHGPLPSGQKIRLYELAFASIAGQELDHLSWLGDIHRVYEQMFGKIRELPVEPIRQRLSAKGIVIDQSTNSFVVQVIYFYSLGGILNPVALHRDFISQSLKQKDWFTFINYMESIREEVMQRFKLTDPVEQDLLWARFFSSIATDVMLRELGLRGLSPSDFASGSRFSAFEDEFRTIAHKTWAAETGLVKASDAADQGKAEVTRFDIGQSPEEVINLFDYLWNPGMSSSGRSYEELLVEILKYLPGSIYRNFALYILFVSKVVAPEAVRAGLITSVDELFRQGQVLDWEHLAGLIGALDQRARERIFERARQITPLLIWDKNLYIQNNLIMARVVNPDEPAVVPLDRYEQEKPAYQDINFFDVGGPLSQIDILIGVLNKEALEQLITGAGTFQDKLKAITEYFNRESSTRDYFLKMLIDSQGQVGPEQINDVLGLFSSDSLRDHYALKALNQEREQHPQRFDQLFVLDSNGNLDLTSENGELNRIVHYFPGFSYTRDDILVSAQQRAKIPEEDLQVILLLMQHPDNVRKPKQADFLTAKDAIRATIKSMEAQQKKEFLFWLLGITDSKPANLVAFEYMYKVSLDSLRETFGNEPSKYYQGVGSSLREDFLVSFLYGQNGVLINPESAKEFIDGIFEAMIPAGSMNIEARELIRKIYQSVFMRADYTRKEALILSLLNQLAQINALNIPNGSRKEAMLFRAALEALGVYGVKLGQFLSTSGIISQELAQEMHNLKDRAKPLNKAVVFDMVKKFYGDFYAHFSELGGLLGSASIKCVYRVRLADGRPMVLKVKRPNVEKKITEDMEFFSAVMEEIRPELEAAGIHLPQNIIQRLKDMVEEEMDFGREKRNQEQIGANMANRQQGTSAQARIFKTILDALSSTTRKFKFSVPNSTEVRNNVLMIEDEVDGIKLSDPQALADAGIPIEDVKRAVLVEMLSELFIDGFYHVDPHSGNILISKDGTAIHMIDLGAAASISQENLMALIGVLIALWGKDQAAIQKYFPHIQASPRAQKDIEIMLGSQGPLVSKLISLLSILEQNDIEVDQQFFPLLRFLKTAQYLFPEDSGEFFQLIAQLPLSDIAAFQRDLGGAAGALSKGLRQEMQSALPDVQEVASGAITVTVNASMIAGALAAIEGLSQKREWSLIVAAFPRLNQARGSLMQALSTLADKIESRGGQVSITLSAEEKALYDSIFQSIGQMQQLIISAQSNGLNAELLLEAHGIISEILGRQREIVALLERKAKELDITQEDLVQGPTLSARQSSGVSEGRTVAENRGRAAVQIGKAIEATGVPAISGQSIPEELSEQLFRRLAAGIEGVLTDGVVLKISKIVRVSVIRHQVLSVVIDVDNRTVSIPLENGQETFAMAETFIAGETKIQDIEIVINENGKIVKRNLLEVLIERGFAPDGIRNNDFAVEYPFDIVRNKVTGKMRVIWGSNEKEFNFDTHTGAWTSLVSSHGQRIMRGAYHVPEQMQEDEELVISGHNHGIDKLRSHIMPSREDVYAASKNAEHAWLFNFAQEEVFYRLYFGMSSEKVSEILSARKNVSKIENEELVIGKTKDGAYGFTMIHVDITEDKIVTTIRVYNFENGKWEDLTVIYDGEPEIAAYTLPEEINTKIIEASRVYNWGPAQQFSIGEDASVIRDNQGAIVSGQAGAGVVGRVVGMPLGKPLNAQTAVNFGNYKVSQDGKVTIMGEDLGINEAVEVYEADASWFTENKIEGNAVILSHKNASGATILIIVIKKGIAGPERDAAFRHELIALMRMKGIGVQAGGEFEDRLGHDMAVEDTNASHESLIRRLQAASFEEKMQIATSEIYPLLEELSGLPAVPEYDSIREKDPASEYAKSVQEKKNAREQVWVRLRPILNVLGAVDVHANLLVKDGKGILVFGPMGSGKSYVSKILAEEYPGWSLGSDDSVSLFFSEGRLAAGCAYAPAEHSLEYRSLNRSKTRPGINEERAFVEVERIIILSADSNSQQLEVKNFAQGGPATETRLKEIQGLLNKDEHFYLKQELLNQLASLEIAYINLPKNTDSRDYNTIAAIINALLPDGQSNQLQPVAGAVNEGKSAVLIAAQAGLTPVGADASDQGGYSITTNEIPAYLIRSAQKDGSSVAQELLQIYNQFPQLARSIMDAYLSVAKNYGLLPKEARLYLVGGRVKGTQIAADSDLDLVFSVDDPQASFEAFRNAEEQEALDLLQRNNDATEELANRIKRIFKETGLSEGLVGTRIHIAHMGNEFAQSNISDPQHINSDFARIQLASAVLQPAAGTAQALYTEATEQEKTVLFESLKQEQAKSAGGYFARFIQGIKRAALRTRLDFSDNAVEIMSGFEMAMRQDRVFHEGLVKDGNGNYWIVKKKNKTAAGALDPRTEKNFSERERLAYLLCRGIANTAEVRSVTLEDAQSIEFLKNIAPDNLGDYYLVRVVSGQNIPKQDLPNKSAAEAYSAILVANVLLQRWDAFYGNIVYADGVPVSIDNDEAFRSDLFGLNGEYFDDFRNRYSYYALIWPIAAVLVASGHNTSEANQRFLATVNEYIDRYSRALEQGGFLGVEQTINNVINDHGLREGFLSAEQIDREAMVQAIAKFTQISNVRQLAIEAGYSGEELESVVDFIIYSQKHLAQNVTEIVQALTGQAINLSPSVAAAGAGGQARHELERLWAEEDGDLRMPGQRPWNAGEDKDISSDKQDFQTLRDSDDYLKIGEALERLAKPYHQTLSGEQYAYNCGVYGELFLKIRNGTEQFNKKRLLEVGPAYGVFMYALKRYSDYWGLGLTITGVELLSRPAELARNAGLDMIHGKLGLDIPAALEGQEFDCVVARWPYFESWSDEEIRDYLEGCSRMTKAGGFCLIDTNVGISSQFQGIIQFSKDAGFDDVKVEEDFMHGCLFILHKGGKSTKKQQANAFDLKKLANEIELWFKFTKPATSRPKANKRLHVYDLRPDWQESVRRYRDIVLPDGSPVRVYFVNASEFVVIDEPRDNERLGTYGLIYCVGVMLRGVKADGKPFMGMGHFFHGNYASGGNRLSIELPAIIKNLPEDIQDLEVTFYYDSFNAPSVASCKESLQEQYPFVKIKEEVGQNNYNPASVTIFMSPQGWVVSQPNADAVGQKWQANEIPVHPVARQPRSMPAKASQADPSEANASDFGPYKTAGRVMRGLDARRDKAIEEFESALAKDAEAFRKARQKGLTLERKKVMIIGAGGGRLTYELMKKYGDAFEFIPVNKEPINLAPDDFIANLEQDNQTVDRKEVEEFLKFFRNNTRYRDVDREGLGVSGASVDYILVAQQTMCYIADQLELVRAIKRALKEGGKGFISDWEGMIGFGNDMRYSVGDLIKDLNQDENLAFPQYAYEAGYDAKAEVEVGYLLINNIAPNKDFPSLKLLEAQDQQWVEGAPAVYYELYYEYPIFNRNARSSSQPLPAGMGGMVWDNVTRKICLDSRDKLLKGENLTVLECEAWGLAVNAGEINPEEAQALRTNNVFRNTMNSGAGAMGPHILTKLDQIINGSITVSAGQDNKGGIDFRALPIVTQPVLGTVPLNATLKPLAGTVPVNMDKELIQIEKMLEVGIRPSTDRIKAYAYNCAISASSQDIDKVLSCIADILRQEEEACCETEDSLRQMLVLLESDQPYAKLPGLINSIIVTPKEPKIKP